MISKKIILSFFLFSFFFPEIGKCQNMVLNWSFESYNTCPNLLPSNISACNNWINPSTSSPDYFHNCAPTSSGYSTPWNAVGYQTPYDGSGYVGLFCFDKLNPNVRDYVTGQLNAPLIPGTKYYVSFMANLASDFGYSVKTVGAYFTSSQPSYSNYYYWPITPQIENTSGNLSDSISWYQVTDSFTAVGGEKFITIGNFRSDSLSDTLNLYAGPYYYYAAYYFIDAVTVIPYDQVGIGELKNLNEDILVYPNPAQNETEIIFDADKTKRIVVTDISGKTIYEYSLSGNLKGKIKHKIDLSNFSKGFYFVSVVGENFSSTKKLIKE